MRSGNDPPSLPLTFSSADVHIDEHQDRRLQRGLLILFAIFPLQHWSESDEDVARRRRAQGCSDSEG